ncbi:alpha/beta fold hydrolase [Saccharopolyspora griseoalba]|uniref:Alpha/beta fold hydrolase n=1 Tax=Saccharopolyspora griseoalba TaxID=1431848 RepID=A0ABW2LBG8_9PSEU
MNRVRVAGADVREAGSGAPVLMLHGIGGAADAFAAQMSGFPGYRTLAWDAPGYGDSADLPGEPVLDDYAETVVSILRGLDAAPAHLLGVSWGGVIATRVALEAPDVLRSLVLADSSRGSGRTDRGRKAMATRVEELRRRGAVAFAEQRGPRLPAPDADPRAVEQVVGLMSRVRLTGYRNAAGVMAATDHSAQLASISTPTLVIVGEQDRVTGVDESRALADGIPAARFEVIRGAGHAANQEKPEEFNRRVRQFLSDVDGGAR